LIVERLLRVALVGSTWVLYLLFGLSVVSFAVMLDRWLYFRKRSDDVPALRRKLKEKLREGDLEAAEGVLDASPSIEAEVLRSALAWRSGGAEAVADALESETARVRKDLERGLNLLGTLGNNAPFVGLFGTVLGVIEAFHQLADTANKAAMGNVMAGISEALVATGVGLFVALPAVVAYNVAQKKIGDIESAAAGLGKLVTAAIKTSEAAHARDRAATHGNASETAHHRDREHDQEHDHDHDLDHAHGEHGAHAKKSAARKANGSAAAVES
jgi:biopolymer transport protein ExbB/biopolymer transport protein TolQ